MAHQKDDDLMKRWLLGLAFCLGVVPVYAAEFPTRPIRIIVPVAPGGASDLTARLIGEAASPLLGQPVVIENRPGANGNLGMDAVAKAPKDGYLLGNCSIGNCGVNPSIYDMPYDVRRDLQPVFWTTSLSNVLVVRSASPIKTVEDFLAAAKTRQMSYGSSGFGSAQQMSSELFGKATETKFLHVPYRGSAPALQGLLGGNIDFLIDNLSTLVGQVQGGELRALAVTGPRRSASLPDVPTLVELGHKVEVLAWFGLVAPAGTPPEVVKVLNDAFNKALQSPAVQTRFKDLDLNPEGGTVERFTTHIDAELTKWQAVVASAGIKRE
jgi:tripartite-type tricarboxylate transporter receptor subunit TctC